ncbi:ATP synthase subunit beta [Verticillium dahliae VDG1]|nr:ATP synthase subunit beta [Verticillium dahliae VDG1]
MTYPSTTLSSPIVVGPTETLIKKAAPPTRSAPTLTCLPCNPTPPASPLCVPVKTTPLTAATTKPDTTSGITTNRPPAVSYSSRKAYLDSLIPPSPEEFNKISQVQHGREVETRKKARKVRRESILPLPPPDTMSRPTSEQSSLRSQPRRKSIEAFRSRRAAKVIQRSYRGYRSRRESKGLELAASTRDANEEMAEKRKCREEATAKRKQDSQMMGLQYFLEMVDLKHRYGSNLRTYHEEWKKHDTNENFFYWLDYGEGQNIDMAACPRDRLEREQVRYLSREERQHYLVNIDEEGALCWAKNGERINTTEDYRDSICGISALEADRAAKYATPEVDDEKPHRKVMHVSASTIFNKMLRKSVRKNTWIFVADTNFRLYVGIKSSGAFQHSSFLQGSRISSAGLIKVKDGKIKSLSPLSGHYRPPTSNFRAFIRSLRESRVDVSHVSISKSYAVLVGLETYVRTRKKGKHDGDENDASTGNNAQQSAGNQVDEGHVSTRGGAAARTPAAA